MARLEFLLSRVISTLRKAGLEIPLKIAGGAEDDDQWVADGFEGRLTTRVGLARRMLWPQFPYVLQDLALSERAFIRRLKVDRWHE